MKSLIQVQRCQPWLGTYVQISARAQKAAVAQHACTAAFKRIAAIHHLMSFHDSRSDVSMLNQEAARRPVQISAETRRVLEHALHVSQVSEGLFDITVAPTLQKWGYLPNPDREPPFSDADYRDIELGNNRQVSFRKPLQIDLGGIAKGFAVDEAVNILLENGVTEGLVNAGGDLRVFGRATWPIFIRHPRFTTRSTPFCELHERAVATSGIYFSKKRVKNQWVSPLVNPKEARPFLKRVSVTVVADTCLVADALTKVVALGPTAANEIVNLFQAQAFITGVDGTSRGLN